jgi:hypothetical protein
VPFGQLDGRGVILDGIGLLVIVALLLGFAATPAIAATQTRADPTDTTAGASGRADLRQLSWNVVPGSATLTLSFDDSTFGAGLRADIGVDVLLDRTGDGLADLEVAGVRNADRAHMDMSLRQLSGINSTADCQELGGGAPSAQGTVTPAVAAGRESFAFSFDPTLVPGALAAFRWAAIGQAPPPGGAGVPWDIMPDAANPFPGAPNPSDRRCGAAKTGLSVRVANGVAFPDPVTPPTPPPPPPPPPPPAPVGVSFATSPDSLRVTKTGSFNYSFLAIALGSGKVSLKSTKKVKVGAKKRFVTLGPKAFTAPITGPVKVKLKLSSKNLKALRKAKKLRFKVTAVIGAASYTTKLTLKAPKKT